MTRPLLALLAALLLAVPMPLATALPNQDDNLLCHSGNVAFEHAHESDCAATYIITGDIGHDTVAALAQTYYPLAMPTLTAPTPPKAKVCATPSTKPRC